MNSYLLVTFFVEGFFGLGFVFLPGSLSVLMGVSLNDIGVSLARLFGTALLAFPVVTWFARRSASLEFKKSVVLGLFVYYLASLVVLIFAMRAGQMNALGWSVVALHLALAGWAGWLAVR